MQAELAKADSALDLDDIDEVALSAALRDMKRNAFPHAKHDGDLLEQVNTSFDRGTLTVDLLAKLQSWRKAKLAKQREAAMKMYNKLRGALVGGALPIAIEVATALEMPIHDLTAQKQSQKQSNLPGRLRNGDLFRMVIRS